MTTVHDVKWPERACKWLCTYQFGRRLFFNRFFCFFPIGNREAAPLTSCWQSCLRFFTTQRLDWSLRYIFLLAFLPNFEKVESTFIWSRIYHYLFKLEIKFSRLQSYHFETFITSCTTILFVLFDQFYWNFLKTFFQEYNIIEYSNKKWMKKDPREKVNRKASVQQVSNTFSNVLPTPIRTNRPAP